MYLKILKSILPSILFLVLVDYISSYITPKKVVHEYPSSEYFEYDPLQMWKLIPGYNDQIISISDQGFRVNPFSEDDENKKRIFLVGGSTVFGLGVLDEQTIAAYLQQLLSIYDSSYHVINAGVTAYYSTQELIHIQRNIVRHQPEMVISLSGRNDVFYSLNPQYKFDQIPYHGLIRDQVGILDPYYTPPNRLTPFHIEDWLMRNIFNQKDFGWAKEWQGQEFKFNQSALLHSINNQVFIHSMLSGINIPHHLFLQPTINYPDREVHKSELEILDLPYLDALAEGYKFLAQGSAEYCHSSWYHGFIYFQDESNPLFIDDAHYTSLGARLAARGIFQGVFGSLDPLVPRALSFPEDLLKYMVFTNGVWNNKKKVFFAVEGFSALLKKEKADKQFFLTGKATSVEGDLQIRANDQLVMSRSFKSNETINILQTVDHMELSGTVVMDVRVINSEGLPDTVQVSSLGFR